MPLNPKTILALRTRLKLTQEEAAKRAGMPQQAWARIEGGKRSNPRLSTAQDVARALGVKLEKLLCA
jgi:transcriptional regulator with XRE-family HTH domain